MPGMASPVVSIVLPVYNYAGYIARAIEGVNAQTYQNVDLIVVDDGSTDGSGDIAERLGARVIRQANRGLAGARNIGIRGVHPDAKYIALLDADDVWAPTKVEKQVLLMENQPRVGLCHTNGRFIYAEGERRNFVPRRIRRPDLPAADHILPGNKIFASSVLLRRDVLERAGPFHEPLRIAEDWDMWFRMAPLCEFAFLPEVLIEYLVHGQNLSRKGSAFWEARIEVLGTRVPAVLDALLNTVPPERRPVLRRHLRRQLALSYSGLAKHRATEGRMDEARRDHWRAIRHSPEIVRLYGRLLRTLLPAEMQKRLTR